MEPTSISSKFGVSECWHSLSGSFINSALRVRTCRELVSQLAKVGSAEEQAACRDRLEQLEPPIRYCSYQLERAGRAAPRGPAEPSSPASARLQVRDMV